jgi:DNA mismatch repair protein MutL
MAAFRQSLLPGQFPAVAVFVEIDPALIDVNVHPTKAEVRFLNSRDIFRSIEGLIEASLVKHGAPTYASPGAGGAENSGPYQFRASESGVAWAASAVEGTPSLWNLAEVQEASHPLSQSTYLGTLFGTYFVFDDKAEMVLVDQHAAHERIRYEKLKKRVTGDVAATSQTLLQPESVKFPAEQRASVESRLSLLSDLGFEAELFGEDTLLIRSVPSEWGMSELGARIKSLTERLIALEVAPTRDLIWDETLFEKLASEACHSAIRAGDRVDTYQALEIVKQLFHCQHPWNCPHGRPTVVRIPRGKLEEWFQRRV